MQNLVDLTEDPTVDDGQRRGRILAAAPAVGRPSGDGITAED